MNNDDMPPSRPTSGRQNATSAQHTTLHSEPVTKRFPHLIKPFNFEDMANQLAIPEEEAARRNAEAARRQAEAEDNSPFDPDNMPPPPPASIFERFKRSGGTRKNRNSKRSMRSKRSSRRSKRSSRRSKRSSRRSRR